MSDVTAAALSRRRRLVFAAALLLLNLLAIEAAARLALVGFLAPTCDSPGRCALALLWPRPLHLYYPELARALGEPPRAESIDVLLLGGSVLHPDWSPVGRALAEGLARSTRRPVVVHNLAMPAHTSRDSLIKYRALAGQHYELVVFYHGINESRANNAPPELFDADYEHYSWYRQVNWAERDPLPPFWVTPAVGLHLGTQIGRKLGLLQLVPTHFAEPEWIAYGHEIRTRQPFRRNLDALLALAAQRSEPLLLMTFATWVPEDYSAERFEAMQTGYTTHQSPLEMWGDPPAVLEAVRVHNAELREAARVSGAALVDQAREMPGRRRFFNDVCHLSVEGSIRFVDRMLPTALALVAPPRGSAP